MFEMKPDAIDIREMKDAIGRMRGAATAVEDEFDDEVLALLIERGIDAVPVGSRAGILRAIGNSPELASIVAELAPERGLESGHDFDRGMFGIRYRTWRFACAACAAIAVGLTTWKVFNPTTRPPADLQLLDGTTQPFVTESIARGFEGTLGQVIVMILWLATCALLFPALSSIGRKSKSTAVVERSSRT